MTKSLVLFVDDDENVLKAWRRSFNQEPYKMLFASSSEEALNLLSQYDIGVLVTDYSMPNGNGIVLLDKVKNNYPNVARMLVSGHATLAVASTAINKCGVSKLFQKPCNLIELGMAIRDGLREFHRISGNPQSSVIFDLELEHPGISQVLRDKDGAIKL